MSRRNIYWSSAYCQKITLVTATVILICTVLLNIINIGIAIGVSSLNIFQKYPTTITSTIIPITISITAPNPNSPSSEYNTTDDSTFNSTTSAISEKTTTIETTTKVSFTTTLLFTTISTSRTPVTTATTTTAKPPVTTATTTTAKPPVTTVTTTTAKPPVTTATTTTAKPPVTTATTTTAKPPVTTATTTTAKPPVTTATTTTAKPPVTTVTITTAKPPVTTVTTTTAKPPGTTATTTTAQSFTTTRTTLTTTKTGPEPCPSILSEPREIKNLLLLDDKTTSSNYTNYAVQFVTPVDATIALLVFSFRTKTGSWYLDDVSLKRSDGSGNELIRNGGFDNGPLNILWKYCAPKDPLMSILISPQFCHSRNYCFASRGYHDDIEYLSQSFTIESNTIYTLELYTFCKGVPHLFNATISFK